MPSSVPQARVTIAPPPLAGRNASARLRTLPEQIAEQLGMAIIDGAYAGGQRILEQTLSDEYGVSRGPVRDALRVLQERGLVQIFPRRGAYAVEVSLDVIADMFNIRGVLLGLAARYFARSRPPAGLAEFSAKTEALAALAGEPAVDATAFALENGRLGAALYRHCGSEYLTGFLREQGHKSFWGLIWRQRPLDFLTPQRRHEAAQLWATVAKAIAAGDEYEADAVVQQIIFSSRDSALAVLSALRKDAVASPRLLEARPRQGRAGEA